MCCRHVTHNRDVQFVRHVTDRLITRRVNCLAAKGTLWVTPLRCFVWFPYENLALSTSINFQTHQQCLALPQFVFWTHTDDRHFLWIQWRRPSWEDSVGLALVIRTKSRPLFSATFLTLNICACFVTFRPSHPWPHYPGHMGRLKHSGRPIYVPPAWTLKSTCFAHRVYLCVSCDIQIKQLLFPQISLTGNGDAVCFCEYRTEFSNSIFIYTHLVLSAVDSTNDEVAWKPAEHGGGAAWIVCFVSCRLPFHRCVWHAKYNPLCSRELRVTFDTPSCCVSNTRLDRHTKQEPWNPHTYSQISHCTATAWRKHVECATERIWILLGLPSK